MASSVERMGAGALLALGMDLSYTLGSFSLSAPQTTERRVRDTEGTPETPQEAMKWVWISTGKILFYTGVPSLISRSWWLFAGGVVAIFDMHASYRYAIACGRRSPTPGGRLVSKLGVEVNGDQGDAPSGRGDPGPYMNGRPQSQVRTGRRFSW